MFKFNNIDKKKQEKGITLVALVVTIVVLLILAGITIENLTGGKNQITTARSNVELSELRQIQEIVMEQYIKYKQTGDEKYLKGDPISKNEVISKINIAGINVSLKGYQYYLLNKETLAAMGISGTDDEYIVNYITGEAINATKWKTSNEDVLYVYAREEDENINVYFSPNEKTLYIDDNNTVIAKGSFNVNVDIESSYEVQKKEYCWDDEDWKELTGNTVSNSKDWSQDTSHRLHIRVNGDDSKKFSSGEYKVEKAKITEIKLANTIVKKGDTAEITAELTGSTSYKTIEFESTNTGVGTVTNTGNKATVTGEGAGTTTITCKVTNHDGTTRNRNMYINSSRLKVYPKWRNLCNTRNRNSFNKNNSNN